MVWTDIIAPVVAVGAPLLRGAAKVVAPVLRRMRRVSPVVARRRPRLSDDALLILCACAEHGGIPLFHPAFPGSGIDCIYTLETKGMIRELKDSGYMYERRNDDGESPHLVATREGEERALREIRKREQSGRARLPIPRIRLAWR